MYTPKPSLSFSEALNSATSRIFQFKGRARRSEYWWTMAVVYLANIILTPILGIFLSIATIPLTFRRLHDTGKSGWWWGAGAILHLALYVSLIADFITLYQTHYTGNEADIVVAFITKYAIWLMLVGTYKILLLVFMCIDSDPLPNKYGESPKYTDCDSGV